ncbi:hypothetical protein Nepgr_004417 [Nepenthes gracilis]|uniref:Stearoyl-[acyl-carrier-protein] 9-desaturase, chloroplastic n=1 Tax=Nepenthes gracilis TaxID=150966 RepID=A0AAD3XF43_NEPGR|nr:hypothetical protein Nepgr_004417 [Nepenthes gracilis]
MASMLNPLINTFHPGAADPISLKCFMAANSPIICQLKMRNVRKQLGLARVAATVQKTEYMAAERAEMFRSMENWVENNVLTLLKPVEKSWQPQDFLPDPSLDEGMFFDRVKEMREMACELPDDYLVILAGAMITEDALPSYQMGMNNLHAINDVTCCSSSPWARWLRGWSAEENRHGDLLNKYLYLSGRVNMKQIEKTIQYLIGSGLVLNFNDDTHRGVIYTSFQERATSISHGNAARLAKQHGDKNLAQICGIIAADEKRHETAYIKIVDKLFEIDPDYTMLAFSDMMKKKISMPGLLMYDGCMDNLFSHYSTVAQRLKIYTINDYADVLEFLIRRWNVEMLGGLSCEAREAQDYVCNLAPKIRKLEERAQATAKKAPAIPFSWIFHRQVKL